jgi:hypothetical protein
MNFACFLIYAPPFVLLTYITFTHGWIPLKLRIPQMHTHRGTHKKSYYCSHYIDHSVRAAKIIFMCNVLCVRLLG